MISRFLCWIGCHSWDMPGGHCRDCHACDELFEQHTDRFIRATPHGPEQHCNGDKWSLSAAEGEKQ